MSVWTEIKIKVKTSDLEIIEAIANMTVPYGIYTEDYSDLEDEAKQISHMDLIDEELLKRDRKTGIVHIYINPEENPGEAISFVKSRLEEDGIKFKLTLNDCKTEDWANNWKRYYHPLKVGKTLLIEPRWERADDSERAGRKVIKMEPGLAFGTGTHPTTKLCLEMIEKYIKPGENVLDVGCGSGILSIAACLLGAKSALAVDIDPLASKTAGENALFNNLKEPVYKTKTGTIDDVTGKYDLIVANIVADIIIGCNTKANGLLKDGGIYITGGIIDLRKSEVENSFLQNNLKIIDGKTKDGWNVFVCKKGAEK